MYGLRIFFMVWLCTLPFGLSAQWPCSFETKPKSNAKSVNAVSLARDCALSACCKETAESVLDTIRVEGLPQTEQVSILLTGVQITNSPATDKRDKLLQAAKLLQNRSTADSLRQALRFWLEALQARYYMEPFSPDSIGNHWLKLEELYRSGIGSKPLRALACFTLTDHYNLLGRKEKALHWGKLALANSQFAPPEYKSAALLNVAWIYYGLGHEDSTVSIADELISIAEALPDYLAKAKLLKGYVVHDQGSMVLYNQLALEAHEHASKTNDVQLKSNCLQQLANSLFHVGKYNDAIALAKQGATAYQNDIDVLFELVRVMFLSAEKLGNYRQALAYHKQLSELQDSISYRKNQGVISELNKRFESEKKDRLIEELKAQAIDVELKSQRTQTSVLLVLISVLLLSSMMVIWLMYRKRLVQKQLFQQEALTKEKIIESARTERERISIILHDTIAGSLAGMTHKSQYLASMNHDTEKRTAELKSISSELNKLYELTRNLSHQLMPVEPKEGKSFSEQLVDYLKQRKEEANQMEVSWLLDHEHELDELELQKKSLILSFLQEAVLNAMRHSQAQNLTVETWRRNNQLGLRVSDDGVGLSNASDSGIGLKGLKLQAESIGAEMKVTEPVGKGTALELIIPIADLHQ